MDFLISQHAFLEICFKLIIATVLSLVIGIERELKKKPVGLKTSLVIAIFSCLLTIISINTAYSTPARDDINITMDPLRLAAQVVSGIGFLGAGVILRRGNESITGLTTAAMIWGAAGIGIAVGAGFYVHAILAVITIVIGIEFIAPFLIKVGPKRLRRKDFDIRVFIPNEQNIESFFQYLYDHNLLIEHVQIIDCFNTRGIILHEINIRCATHNGIDTIKLYMQLKTLPYIERVEIDLIR